MDKDVSAVFPELTEGLITCKAVQLVMSTVVRFDNSEKFNVKIPFEVLFMSKDTRAVLLVKSNVDEGGLNDVHPDKSKA